MPPVPNMTCPLCRSIVQRTIRYTVPPIAARDLLSEGCACCCQVAGSRLRRRSPGLSESAVVPRGAGPAVRYAGATTCPCAPQCRVCRAQPACDAPEMAGPEMNSRLSLGVLCEVGPGLLDVLDTRPRGPFD